MFVFSIISVSVAVVYGLLCHVLNIVYIYHSWVSVAIYTFGLFGALKLFGAFREYRRKTADERFYDWEK